MLVQLLKPILKKLFIEPGKEQAYPNGWACSVEGARATGQKEVRIIENLEPVMNQHRLIMDFNVAENTDLTFQMVHITRQRGCLEHEDELDSLAGCVAQFESVMDQDVEEAAKITEEEGEGDFWDEEPEQSTLWATI
ncbi:MAG: hypothetical protein JKX85_15700 [Phycisphaeraceae bacterium]|nr:hypothetical protein [Phycisphaeraceae bacterium]